MANEINVLKYGAVGDGVADDTGPLDAAMADLVLSVANGKRASFVLPAGSYRRTAILQFRDLQNFHVEADGAEIISQDSTNHVVQFWHCRDFSLGGSLHVHAENPGARLPTPDGVNILACAHALIEGVDVGYTRSIGIRPQASRDITIAKSRVRGTLADGIGCYSGLRQSGANGSITATSTTLNCPDGANTLNSDDVGAVVIVSGAGVAGSALLTSIVSVGGPHTATLLHAASTTVTAANVIIGGGCADITIESNFVDDTGDDSYSCVANYLAGAVEWNVSNTNIKIVDNISKNSAARGVVIDGADGFLVAGNMIEDSFGIGIQVQAGAHGYTSRNGAVKGNVLRNSGGTHTIAIGSTATARKVQDVLVDGNVAHGGLGGFILIGNATEANATHRVKAVNNRRYSTPTSQHGIEASRVGDVEIMGNLVDGSWLSGIIAHDNTGVTMIHHNSTRRSDLSASGWSGIEASDLASSLMGNVSDDGYDTKAVSLGSSGSAKNAWYTVPRGSTVSAVSLGVAAMTFQPLELPVECTADRIACEVTAIGSAGAVVRLGIYACNANGMPGALVLDAGTVAADDIAGIKEITINQPLRPGRYWLCAATQVAASTLRSTSNDCGAWLSWSDTSGITNPRGGYRGNQAGAFPNSAAVLALTSNTWRVALRLAVP